MRANSDPMAAAAPRTTPRVFSTCLKSTEASNFVTRRKRFSVSQNEPFALKKDSKAALKQLEDQLAFLTSGWSEDYGLQIEEDISKWFFRMSVVEVHSVWERFCEDRLTIALNHDPKHFLERYEVRGVSHISKGLAYYIVRGGLSPHSPDNALSFGAACAIQI